MSRRSFSNVLLAAAVLFAASAVATLVPSSASKISDLGYYTLCPFAPWSTLALLFLGGVSLAVRQYLNSNLA